MNKQSENYNPSKSILASPNHFHHIISHSNHLQLNFKSPTIRSQMMDDLYRRLYSAYIFSFSFTTLKLLDFTDKIRVTLFSVYFLTNVTFM